MSGAATATDAEAEEYMKARGEEIAKKYEDEKVTRWTQPAAMKVRAITVSAAANASGDQRGGAREDRSALAEVRVARTSPRWPRRAARPGDEATAANLGFVARSSRPREDPGEQAAKLKRGRSARCSGCSGFHVLRPRKSGRRACNRWTKSANRSRSTW